MSGVNASAGTAGAAGAARAARAGSAARAGGAARVGAEEMRGGISLRVGWLLQLARERAGATQEMLAERAATSQQWVSRVEAGAVNLRLRDAERLFSAVGASLLLRVGPPVDEAAGDPDLVPAAEMDSECELFLSEFSYVLRKFRDVPLVIGGRLAALAQGLGVRPFWLDLVIAESDVPAANRAMGWMNGLRWSEFHQDYTGYDRDLESPAPRRWLLNGGLQFRVEIVAERPAALTVAVGDRSVAVRPLFDLLRADPDLADLAARVEA